MSELATARYNMVECQVRTNDVTDTRILSAMGDLPREAFLPEALQGIAYMDDDIPMSVNDSGKASRYLMSPLSFSQMLQSAEIGSADVVLDVGCGTGYSSAVIARLADSVIGLECDEALAESATQNLASLTINNAAIMVGDLASGYEEQEPYDVILLEGSVPQVPVTLLEQLKDGGRLLAIIGNGGLGKLTQFYRAGEDFSEQPLIDAGCAPLPGFDVTPKFVF